jgi:hypothetical protein
MYLNFDNESEFVCPSETTHFTIVEELSESLLSFEATFADCYISFFVGTATAISHLFVDPINYNIK